jgi:hypothetical protein
MREDMFIEEAVMATKKAPKNKGTLYFVTSGLLVAAMIAAAIYYAEPSQTPDQLLLDPAQRSSLTPDSSPS